MPRILTWNLNGLDAHRLDERTEAACLGLLLRDEPPDVVLLQEVVDRSLTAHLRPHFSNAGYMAAIQPASGEYYCAAFVRTPLKLTGAAMHPLRSPQGRVLLELEVMQGFTPWRIGTAHLESGPHASTERGEQLAYCLRRAAEHTGPAVFAGDTNLRAREHAGLVSEVGVRDAWIALGEDEASRSTWEPPGGRSVRRWFRFDRMYANDRVDLTELSAFQLQIEGEDVDCSDHRALELVCSTR